jgi:hypothetical protein
VRIVMTSPDHDDDDKPAAAPRDASPGDAKPDTPPRSRRRDPRFRTLLIEKLPKLGFTSWSAKEDFKADEEWAGIVSLRSDAVLGPLESLVPGRRHE